MKKIRQWNGKQEDNIEIEYEVELGSSDVEKLSNQISAQLPVAEYDKPDKADYLVAASCGILTGLLDSFLVGEFSLTNAQTWGRSNINDFVIKVAQICGYKKDSLEGAIRFLEKKAPMATDKLTNEWGGGYYHHFRDFSHHASIIGLIFSLITQFTGVSYGTNTEGLFEKHELLNTDLIGKTFEEKIYLGVVMWALHLISDMAGSSSNPGRGTGIPGPIMSLLKGLSVLPGIKSIKFTYNDKQISVSAMLSKLFNGTIFEHTGTEDLTHFDLRTELGVYVFGAKQSISIVINQCVIRAFYFVRRFIIELGRIKVKSVADLKRIVPKHFLPYNNKCITRMSTIASGVFCVVDTSDATIRTIISKPNSKGEFVTRLLLKANFTGICNFAISIKNDVLMSLKGEPATNIKPEMLVDGADIGSDAFADLVFDVSVEIDNNGLYEYIFYRMYNDVKDTKERLSDAYAVYNGIQRRIFRLEDDETALYDQVASCSSHALMIETEELMMRLFTLYGIDYYPFEGNEKYNYMPFYRIVEGKKFAYVFSKSIASSVTNWEYIIKEYDVDKIIVVALVEFGEDSATRDSLVRLEMKKTKGYIEYILLKDLFALISENEYDTYLTYVEQYNSDIKKLIGYRTIITPSDSSLMTMKKDLEDSLRAYNFDAILIGDGLYVSQIESIKHHFWDGGRYRAILGKSSFAESFISSEWYYQTHTATSTLEQTAIIAGYLKSVEQLLYTIIKFSINTGKSIKKLGGKRSEYIEFTTDSENSIDTSLGSLIGFSRHYSELWTVNSFVKNYIANKLSEFRERYRNDHFHKDNIYRVEEIEAIRNNTILLLYLMLGAMNISDSDFDTIDYVKDDSGSTKTNELSYTRFERWLNRILGGDVLLPTSSKIYFSVAGYGSQGKTWRIQFVTYKGFDKNGFFNIDELQYPYIGDEFEFDYSTNSYEELEKAQQEVVLQVKEIIREYLNQSKYSKKLKCFHSISAGLMVECHPEILYKRS